MLLNLVVHQLTQQGTYQHIKTAIAHTDDVIKVGILHSLTGPLAASERALRDAECMAIAEINASGGLLGKQIVPIIKDGKSDNQTFVEQAIALITQDQVVTVFGCWTSASRKAVLPVFESKNHLLWYPVDYEGQECSNNIFYIGAAPNQQIEPAVDWLLEQQWDRFYLVGSDYVFPYTTNQIIKAQLLSKGVQAQGEEYTPLCTTDFRPVIAKIKAVMPKGGVIFNTVYGDSNISFYRQLKQAGMDSDRYPVMSVSISEQEVRRIGATHCAGHYAAWNYFQSVDTPENHRFVQNFKRKYGEDRVTDDPIEAAYISVYLWQQAVIAAGTTDIDKVRAAAIGQSIHAPSGQVTLEANHHCSKIVRIGQIRPDGQFQIVFATPHPVEPMPWNQNIVSRAIEELWEKNYQLQNLNSELEDKTQLLEKTLYDLKMTQAQLIQTEKMSSIGLMVAGVAHEINNPVNFIDGNLAHASKYIQDLSHLLGLYRQYYPRPVPTIAAQTEAIDVEYLINDLPKILSSMRIGVDRICEIVASLRTFSRVDQVERKSVDIHEGIDSTLMLLKHRFKIGANYAVIQVIKEYGDLPPLECYPGQLNQVFMNILSNAIDALEEQPKRHAPKTITIKTEMTSDHQVKVRIRDNGPGIPPDLQSKLFDPFFTTKPVGKGTGLGLSICYQIVEKHNGSIQILSELGKGTEFVISLPQQVKQIKQKLADQR